MKRAQGHTHAAAGSPRPAPSRGASVAARPQGKRRGLARRLGPVTQRAGGGDDALRQCVVCRARRPRLSLLQVLARPAGASRHAYVCIARPCLLRALGEASDEQALHAQAAQRLGEVIGLARRSGQLRLGAQAIVARPPAPGAVVLVASDSAERTRRQLGEAALPAAHSASELAQKVGARRPLAAVLLEPGRHATQAAYWQQVWYETQPREGQGHIEVGQ